jgi:hypothetical protein
MPGDIFAEHGPGGNKVFPPLRTTFQDIAVGQSRHGAIPIAGQNEVFGFSGFEIGQKDLAILPGGVVAVYEVEKCAEARTGLAIGFDQQPTDLVGED